jgi:hypothetical protein
MKPSSETSKSPIIHQSILRVLGVQEIPSASSVRKKTELGEGAVVRVPTSITGR